jgi:hypothetical protein
MDENTSRGDARILPSDLPAQQVGILQGIITGHLQKLLNDLRFPGCSLDLRGSRSEVTIFERLLNDLERGESIRLDPETCENLRALAVRSDEANQYSAMVTEHDALRELLGRVEGKEGSSG